MSVEEFGPGDLSLYISNLPHFYMSNPFFYSGDTNLSVKAIVFKSPINYFHESQLHLTEFSSVNKLLKSASSSLLFSTESAKKGGEILQEIMQKSGMERHLLFVKLVDYLGNSESRKITTPDYKNEMKDQREPRMAKIYKFTTKITTEKEVLKK